MLAEFLNYIEEHSLINSDQRILLHVSGGIDHVATDLHCCRYKICRRSL